MPRITRSIARSIAAPTPAPPIVSKNEIAGSILSPRYSPTPPTSSPPVVVKRQPSPSLGPVSPRIINSIEAPPPNPRVIRSNFYGRDATPVDSRESSTHGVSPVSDKENSSPQALSTSRHNYTFTFGRGLYQRRPALEDLDANHSESQASTSTRSGSGLKLRLRGVQAALREYDDDESNNPAVTNIAGRKRPAHEITAYDDDDDTDSEIEIFISVRRAKKAAKLQAGQHASQRSQRHQRPARVAFMPRTRRQAAAGSSSRPHLAQESIDEQSEEEEVDQVYATDNVTEQKTSLITPTTSLTTPTTSLVAPNALKRNKRILDPKNAQHQLLVANATKVGADYYDSDADEADGEAKDTNKPELFRHVVWGAAAKDYTNAADFPTDPQFTQFVPGRFELLADGTVADQKAKLIIKLTDKNNRKRIFANPPPRDWNSQDAITALNKRTVQQIRRNTNVRFREVVQAYLPIERQWILANLTSGKPANGWKQFVDDFNTRFQGQVLPGAAGPRPLRTHSSLTKEVERFGEKFYRNGAVPVLSKKGKGVKK